MEVKVHPVLCGAYPWYDMAISEEDVVLAEVVPDGVVVLLKDGSMHTAVGERWRRPSYGEWLALAVYVRRIEHGVTDQV